MPEDNQANLCRGLRDLITAEFVHDDTLRIEDETPLIEWGIIDSFNMFRILVHAEERFGVTIPLETVVPDDFQSIAALAKLVERRRNCD